MNALEAKVDAANRCRVYANMLFPKLVQYFLPLIGKKVVKMNGDVLEKHANQIMQMHDGTLQVVQNSSFCWTVTATTANDKKQTHYQHVLFYVGSVDEDGILETVNEFQPFQTNYTVEMVEKLRTEFLETRKHLDQIRTKLLPFGEIPEH